MKRGQPDNLKILLGNFQYDITEHLDKTTVTIQGKAPVPALFCQSFDRQIIESQVEDGIHHPGHRELRTGTYGDKERISFINLPGQCELRIYSLTGDLIEEMENTDPYVKVLDWDLISKNQQKVVAGIYLFHVENIDDAEDYDAQGNKTVDDETIGKFVIIR